ncbi:phosphoribosylaminoimidazole-succinocarboxamide synthase [Colletotrichum tofieldiae]|uniref:Phosphoribosylaminoimidazole-succinocarboxamide synthase n=1 Tax=Colletotrichum tofieldiae TaxID=708197 RepID=A0A166T273_9PEZI|nr:phosphoribosylaminoimidazole-succinocarboxamide synthase [Colletotrichum tofieldiae]GKT62644.1 phosphoribosylaminoimidazole-succinocarboxamide synthase [Colletotrichum tofieldiae]GKT69311.1 phosphoribosylaminoimidazole-succinocarboxamide synthase [Colletotrichum tofieldiae]
MYSRNAQPDTFVQEQRGQYPPQFWSARTPSQQSSTPNTLRPHHAARQHHANAVEEQDSSPQETLSPPPDFVPHAPSPPSQQPRPSTYHPEQNFPAPVVIGSMFNTQDPYVSQPAVRFNEAQLAMDEVTNRARGKGFRDELTIAANGSVTPGVDDTPYLRYALEALTREHSHNFSPPSSVPSPAENTGYYRVAGYLPDNLESPQISGDPEGGFTPMVPVPSHARDSLRRQSRPQSHGGERPSMSLGTRIISMSPPHSADSRYHPHQEQAPVAESAPKWLPISEKESVFPGMTKLDTMDEDRVKFPRLNHVPAILRLPSMLLLTVLCVVMGACLMVAAVYSPIQPGLLTYGETIYSGKYFLFRLLPQIVAAVIFVYTQCVTTATLRILPFVALSEDEPLRRRNALFQNLYPKTFLLPQLAGPVQVKIALAMLWLGAFTIPLASASFTVILNDEVWYWTAVRGVVWTLVALYVLVIGSVVLLMLFWRNRVTGLIWDPRSIADFSVMISRSNTRDSYRGSEVAENRDILRRVLRNRIVDRLGYWMTDNNQEMPWYGLGTEHSQGHTPSDHYDVKNESDRLSVTSHLIDEGRDDYIRTLYLPWCLRTGQVLFFVVAATILLTALFVVSFLNRTSLIAGFRPGVPAGPTTEAFSAANFLYSFVPSSVGLLLYLAFQSIEQYLRILQPWADLGAKDGAPAGRSVLADYAACLPLQSTLHALRNGHWRIAALSLLTFLFAFLPALGGGLFMALTAASGVRMFPNVPVFGVILALLVLYLFGLASLLFGRNQYRLPHAVTCPAEIFSFLANEDNAQDPAFQAAPRSREKLRIYLGAGPGSTTAAAQSTWMFGYWPGRDERRLGVRRQKRFTERKSFHERAPSRPSMI